MKAYLLYLNGLACGSIYGWNLKNAQGRAKLLYPNEQVMVVETEDEHEQARC